MKRIVSVIIICMMMVFVSSVQVNADQFLPPEPFEIWSEDGVMVFRWVPGPDHRTAQAGVYQDGVLVYSIKNLPALGVSEHNFFLSQDFMHLVFIPATHGYQSMYWFPQYESTGVALVFYSNGELVKAHYISDLVSDMSRPMRTVTAVWWRSAFPVTRAGAYHKVEYDILRVMTVERIIFEFDLTTGEILSYAPYDTPLTETDIIIKVNDNKVDFRDQRPLVQNNRTLVPVRDVFEAMGYIVSWHEYSQEVSIQSSDGVFHIRVGIGALHFWILTTELNSEQSSWHSHYLYAPVQIVGGRIMVPIRPMLEGIGYQLEWDALTNIISITSKSPGLFQGLQGNYIINCICT